jgi:hypothetical protein
MMEAAQSSHLDPLHDRFNVRLPFEVLYDQGSLNGRCCGRSACSLISTRAEGGVTFTRGCFVDPKRNTKHELNAKVLGEGESLRTLTLAGFPLEAALIGVRAVFSSFAVGTASACPTDSD